MMEDEEVSIASPKVWRWHIHVSRRIYIDITSSAQTIATCSDVALIFLWNLVSVRNSRSMVSVHRSLYYSALRCVEKITRTDTNMKSGRRSKLSAQSHDEFGEIVCVHGSYCVLPDPPLPPPADQQRDYIPVADRDVDLLGERYDNRGSMDG